MVTAENIDGLANRCEFVISTVHFPHSLVSGKALVGRLSDGNCIAVTEPVMGRIGIAALSPGMGEGDILGCGDELKHPSGIRQFDDSEILG